MKRNHRQWLNSDKTQTAYITWDVNDTTSNGETWASFTIKDCFKEATLDFSAGGPVDIKSVKKKLRMIKAAIEDFEKALNGSLSGLIERKSIAAAKNKKKKFKDGLDKLLDEDK